MPKFLNLMIFFLFAALVGCVSTRVSRNPASSSGRTRVLYFGGYGATPQQMSCWQAGAEKNSTGGIDFEAIPYPSGASSSAASVIAAGRSTTSAKAQEVASAIEGDPSLHYYIVGHSSGSSLAYEVLNSVMKEVLDSSHLSQITLIDLDGFLPPAAIRQKIRTTCWSAENGSGMRSKNASSDAQCQDHRVYHDDHCNTDWCLHFSLVDKTTPANLGTNFQRDGYDGCDTNLDWLQ